MSITNKLFLIAILISTALFPLIPLTQLGFSKETFYSVASRNKAADHRFMHREIFKKTGDIDILFLGSSFLWAAMDSKYVKIKLESQLNRPVTVLNFGHNWNGIDIDYLYLKDLLKKRRVKMVVMSTDIQRSNPHPILREIWDPIQDGSDLKELSLEHQLSFYGARILTDPKRFYSSIQQTLKPTAPYSPDNPIYFLNAEFGDVKVKKGYKNSPFEYAALLPREIPASLVSNRNLEWINSDITIYTEHFVKKMLNLFKENSIKLVWINIPEWQHRRAKSINTNSLFQKQDDHSDFIGITGHLLFNELKDADIKKLYYNNHLNANGNAYFTQAITPILVKLYEDKIGFN